MSVYKVGKSAGLAFAFTKYHSQKTRLCFAKIGWFWNFKRYYFFAYSLGAINRKVLSSWL